MHVDHRKAHWIARNLAFARDQRRRILDQANIGGCAADIEGDDVGEAGARHQVDRAGHAGGGSRDQRPDRPVSGLVGRGEATVGLLDVRPGAEAERGGARLELIEIAAHDRTEPGIDDRRAGAFVFAKFGQHFVRGANECVGQGFSQPGDNLFLVSRVLIAMQKHHSDSRNLS